MFLKMKFANASKLKIGEITTRKTYIQKIGALNNFYLILQQNKCMNYPYSMPRF